MFLSHSRLWCSVLIASIVLWSFGTVDSPYQRVGPGPMIRVGRPERGDWSVTTVRVRESTWFQWAIAKLTGERTVRNGASAAPPDPRSMDVSQTYAALVAAQLAARRTPDANAGLQVSELVRPTGLHPGDVLLAAGAGRNLRPLYTEADLRAAAVRHGKLHILVVPRASADAWGSAVVKQVPAAWLAGVRAGPAVSAVAYPLRGVLGPSAGLMLALARVDELTSGDLTGGRRVAGTGAISLDGTVTGVGEIGEKIRAAQADVFFVPMTQHAIAIRAAHGTSVRIVPVRSVSEAVGWLCANGGRASVC